MIRGVNLGGWLVLEKWITPGLFKGTLANDELNLCRQLGPESAQERLQAHRASYITEEDIAWIADHGLNAVRVPVGYWLFEDRDGFIGGGHQQLDWLFSTAEKHGIQVLVDIHAAPGSQNGWDHSGVAGSINWHKNYENVAATLEFLRRLCERYGNQNNLLGIELLNEPHWKIPQKILAEYYRQGYAVVRELCSSDVSVIISDSFRPYDWKDFGGSEYVNLILDTHLYQAFDWKDKRLSMMKHIQKAKDDWAKQVDKTQTHLPMLIGEWSIALDLPAFRGLDDFERDRGLQAYGRVQQKTFNVTRGWFYWTYKTEEGGAWSLRDSVARGWLDNNFSIQ